MMASSFISFKSDGVKEGVWRDGGVLWDGGNREDEGEEVVKTKERLIWMFKKFLEVQERTAVVEVYKHCDVQ